MTDFRVDMKRVSANVSAEVGKIKEEGKKIEGSADELLALQNLSQQLANNGANRHERAYVDGLVVEYQTKVAEEEAEAANKKQKHEVSDAARKDLKNIKKSRGDKNELNEAEARDLLDLIKNTRGDYNPAEIEYFKQELIKAGFGDLLNDLEKPEEPKQPESPVAEEVPAEQPATPESPSLSQPEAPSVGESPAEQPAENPNGLPQNPDGTVDKPLPSTGDDKSVIVNPRPSRPRPVNPTPVNPTPVNPTPVNPTPVNPEPVNPTPAKPKGNGLRFKATDVPNRAHLIIKASDGPGTDEDMFIDNVTVGAKRYTDGSNVADKYLHGRQPFNAAEARAIDAQLRQMTGKGLLEYMGSEFKIGGGSAEDQYITQLYRQYITYGLKEN